MCVIAAKPAGIEMPTDKELMNMWNRNPDGAGIMYALGGKVHIEKGFMDYPDIREKLYELDDKYGLKDLPVVMHFRITTHGGTKPENTHPFPISDSIGMLKKLKLTTKVGVAHNGIIPVTPRKKDISDTMEYIAGQLAPLSRAVPKFYKDKNLMQLIDYAVDGKMAFLAGDSKIYTVGKFIEHNGIMYSNDSFEHTYSWRDISYCIWDNTWRYEDMVASGTLMTLQWIDEARGEFVLSHEGGYAYGEFAIDEAGNVYEYDYDADAMRPAYDMYALNGEGMPMKFNLKSDMVNEELVIW